MSRATILAESFGAKWCNATALIISAEELEAFYHAARAEVLMEAADVCNASTRPTEETSKLAYGLAEKFRAMADREGK